MKIEPGSTSRSGVMLAAGAAIGRLQARCMQVDLIDLPALASDGKTPQMLDVRS